MNIFQGWIFFRCDNFQGWIFFRSEYFPPVSHNLLGLVYLFVFFSAFCIKNCWLCWVLDNVKYSMLSRSFLEFSWQFCLKYCCLSQNCSHIFRDKALYKNITFWLYFLVSTTNIHCLHRENLMISWICLTLPIWQANDISNVFDIKEQLHDLEGFFSRKMKFQKIPF